MSGLLSLQEVTLPTRPIVVPKREETSMIRTVIAVVAILTATVSLGLVAPEPAASAPAKKKQTTPPPSDKMKTILYGAAGATEGPAKKGKRIKARQLTR